MCRFIDLSFGQVWRLSLLAAVNLGILSEGEVSYEIRRVKRDQFFASTC
jgi:hypothetical protein